MQIKKKSSLNNKILIENISLSKKLREENKSNDLFEIMIGNLTLEELIALKLEMTYKNIGKPLYGIKLLRISNYIIQDAIFKFVLSVLPSKYSARVFLGLDKKDFNNYLEKYSTQEYLYPKELKSNESNNRRTIKEDL